MTSDSDQNDQGNEGNFYKGLFYGVVLGLGLVWFLGTKEGRKVKNELLGRGEDLLSRAGGKLENLPEEDEGL